MKILKEKYSKLMKNKKKGFTLIELVVVIAIMAILALIIVPNLTAYIGKADVAKIQANLKTVHTAAEMVDKSEMKLEDPSFRGNVYNYAEIDGNYDFYREDSKIVVSYYDKDGNLHIFDGIRYHTVDSQGGPSESGGEGADGYWAWPGEPGVGELVWYPTENFEGDPDFDPGSDGPGGQNPGETLHSWHYVTANNDIVEWVSGSGGEHNYTPGYWVFSGTSSRVEVLDKDGSPCTNAGSDKFQAIQNCPRPETIQKDIWDYIGERTPFGTWKLNSPNGEIVTESEFNDLILDGEILKWNMPVLFKIN